jgi:hypothetical protein
MTKKVEMVNSKEPVLLNSVKSLIPSLPSEEFEDKKYSHMKFLKETLDF